MPIVKTIVEWAYEPISYFEGSVRHSARDFEINFENGLVSVMLSVPQYPIPAEIMKAITERIEIILLLRQLIVHKPFKLSGFTINNYHPDGSKDICICITDTVNLVCATSSAEIIIKDNEGNITYDSRIARIKEQNRQIEEYLRKHKDNDILKLLLSSYSRAVSDPRNKLIYLYEIREALSKKYGGEAKAIVALGISKNRWKRLGILANVEPLEEGRHRGKDEIRRAASSQEIQEARNITRELIESYVRTL